MKKKSYFFTLIAFVLGAVLGLTLNKEVGVLQLVGSVFVRMIKLAVVPLVLVAVINSILNIHGKRNAKKMVTIVLTIFVVSTAISASIGVINSLVVKPGGSDIVIDGDELLITTPPTFNEFVLNLIPTNPFSSLVDANTFHIIVLAAIIGLTIVSIGKEKLPTTVKFIEDSNEIIMKYIQTIVKVAPLGVFALTANSFATYGQSMIPNLMKYLVTIIVSVVLIYFIYFLALVFFAKHDTKDSLKRLIETWAVAASTSSSAATLPVSMQTCDDLGINKEISRFVLPFGVTMNMNGAAQFMAVTFVFLAQVYGTSLSVSNLILAVLMITILVMATPGIPGGAMVPTTIVLSTFGIPVEYFAIVLGLYGMIDMLDTTLNVTGDIVCSIIVEKVLEKE